MSATIDWAWACKGMEVNIYHRSGNAKKGNLIHFNLISEECI